MGVADVISGTGFELSSLSGAFQGMGFWILAFFGSILVAGILALITYVVALQLRFNKKIVLFKKINNVPIPVGNDKGMFVRISVAGDYWLKTRKFKKILPRPSLHAGKNTYWYYEREDGEWINFSLEDIDEKMKKAKAYYTDEDMRLQRLGIQKNLQERFQKLSFMQKYGALLINLVYIIFVTISLVLLFREMKGNWAAAESAALAVRDLAISVEHIAQRIGGGVAPA